MTSTTVLIDTLTPDKVVDIYIGAGYIFWGLYESHQWRCGCDDHFPWDVFAFLFPPVFFIIRKVMEWRR